MSICNDSGENSYKNDNALVSFILSLPPQQFALFSSVIGLILTENLNLDQQNSLGNFIVGLGQTILVAAAQGQYLVSISTPESNNENSDYKPDDNSECNNSGDSEDKLSNSDLSLKLDNIEKQIENLKKDINNLSNGKKSNRYTAF